MPLNWYRLGGNKLPKTGTDYVGIAPPKSVPNWWDVTNIGRYILKDSLKLLRIKVFNWITHRIFIAKTAYSTSKIALVYDIKLKMYGWFPFKDV